MSKHPSAEDLLAEHGAELAEVFANMPKEAADAVLDVFCDTIEEEADTIRALRERVTKEGHA